uniref:Uncharacterized protein n=1 Tax=Corethron hystrix TaxID=216773 RepID=A0A7S1FXL9_9STRA|mmetsp:Transcript_38630/g.89746  ORF Transcript_38630/g.89746 Transcript_38630/m.89746 type:complete len:161 (+) Transcript_38630:3-485(+)
MEGGLFGTGDAGAAARIDGTEPETRNKWAEAAGPKARAEAAARLARRPERVAGFARRCAGEEDGEKDAVDGALRAVAWLLLCRNRDFVGVGKGAGDREKMAYALADGLRTEYGEDAVARAGLALDALSLNVGVPRDMGMEAARALRSHLRILSAAIRDDL